MPLNIDIKVNGRLLSVLTIGRLEAFKGHTEEHEYIIFEEYHADRDPDKNGVHFMHRYNQGEQVCTTKGLMAWVKIQEEMR